MGAEEKWPFFFLCNRKPLKPTEKWEMKFTNEEVGMDGAAGEAVGTHTDKTESARRPLAAEEDGVGMGSGGCVAAEGLGAGLGAQTVH